MHKLVILVESLENWDAFHERWPEFLRLAEEMPGLRRETNSQVERFLFGKTQIAQMYEFYFDNLAQAEQAMNSPQGREAGQVLTQITEGRVFLFLAGHLQDELENIRAYKQHAGEKLDEDPHADAR